VCVCVHACVCVCVCVLHHDSKIVGREREKIGQMYLEGGMYLMFDFVCLLCVCVYLCIQLLRRRGGI